MIDKIIKVLACVTMLVATHVTYGLDSRDRKDLARYFTKVKTSNPEKAAFNIALNHLSDLNLLSIHDKASLADLQTIQIKIFAWNRISYLFAIYNDDCTIDQKIELIRQEFLNNQDVKSKGFADEAESLVNDICNSIPECKNIK